MWKYRTAVSDRYQLLKDFARENRKNPTLAETVLWQSLKSDTIGTKVLRQHIIGDYIVDFLIPYYNLVIEVDGGYHAERTQQEDDAVRSDFLNSNGFCVMRFTNEQVLYDTQETINRIKEIINKIKTPITPPGA